MLNSNKIFDPGGLAEGVSDKIANKEKK